MKINIKAPSALISDLKKTLDEKKSMVMTIEKAKLASTLFKESVETTGHIQNVIDAIMGLRIVKKAAEDDQDESDEQEERIRKAIVKRQLTDD